jgi:hypothetical protein
VHVPGDYATIQGALSAGMTSLCVSGGTYDENIIGGPSAPVTIVGSGAQATLVNAFNWRGPGDLTLSDVTVENGFVVQSGTTVLAQDCTLTLPPNTNNPNGEQVTLEAEGSLLGGGIELSHCDLSGGSLATVYVDGISVNRISIHDSVFHGVAAQAIQVQGVANVSIINNTLSAVPSGIILSSSGGSGPMVMAVTANVITGMGVTGGSGLGLSSNDAPGGSATITGNTFSNFETGLELDLSGNMVPFSVSYDGNTISDDATGVIVNLKTPDATKLEHSGNTYTGNTNNFGGAAQPD